MASDPQRERLSILASGVTEVIELLENRNNSPGGPISQHDAAERLRRALERAMGSIVREPLPDPTIYGICKEPECQYVHTMPVKPSDRCPKCGTREPPLTPEEAFRKREARATGQAAHEKIDEAAQQAGKILKVMQSLPKELDPPTSITPLKMQVDSLKPNLFYEDYDIYLKKEGE